MARLKLIEPIVEQALIEEPATREDNFLLYVAVLRKFIDPKMSIEDVFKNHVLLGIPALETITRCRRKLQEEKPQLRSEKATAIRTGEEQQYKDYSKD